MAETSWWQNGLFYDGRDEFERRRSNQESRLQGSEFDTFEAIADKWEAKVNQRFPGITKNAIRRVATLADIQLAMCKQLSLGEFYELAISRLIRRSEEQSSNTNQLDLTEEDFKILEYLNNSPISVKHQEDIAQAVFLSRKTVGNHLKLLKTARLVRPPKGKTRGVVITAAGQSRLPISGT